MSSANKAHKVLAQAQRTIKKFGWTKGTWFAEQSGVCLEGAVGIRGWDNRTRTPARTKACEYINEAAKQIVEKTSRVPYLGVPQINDSLITDEEQALEVLALAEQLAYKDYLEEQFTITFNEGEEDEEEIEIDFSVFAK